MTPERLNEIRELLFQLEKKMRPLDWDLSRNQINEFKKHELARLKEQHVKLQNEFTALQNSLLPGGELQSGTLLDNVPQDSGEQKPEGL